MPTYAYRCTVCGHEFEAKQSFADDALTVCPECGGALRKLFSSVGVVFKGSGFYRNDSRSTSTSTAPASEPAKTAAPKETAKPASTTPTSTAAKSTAAKSAS
ncbi:FmdB family zinc ribbon protein [Georgenia muralis]|uniref:Putative FmdB family regulatory protein n=1 Tax=Georgenia muralis TaxID=154117 RepID=A0A3N4Z3A6_9MICO|nr:FmdB family zinc ribbon protein [Georgenia muralis]RPF26136.1 putative FmdB family regulatory protein [Georgenia muralis]